MKKITLLFVLLFAGFSTIAQTTHNLDWYMGISTTDASLTIDAGDTVIWTFTDAPSHSVTSDASSTETFDSGILSTGIGTTYSYTFATAGTNPYHCGVHPSMVGTITVNAIALCADPSNIVISNITDTSGDVGWTENGTAAEWEIEYGITGFTPGTGTIISDNDGTLGETLTGLTASTSYDVYVTAICGPGDESIPVGPVAFTTTLAPCPPPSNPVVVNIAQTTVDLSWTAPAGGPFESEWGVFTLGGDPSIDDPLISGDVAIGVTSVQITGLTPETIYDLYLRTVCDENTDYYSDPPTGPITFTTLELGVSSQVFETFSYYPNPANSELFLKASSEIQEVIVYDLLGREILKIQPNSLESTLELSDGQEGAYLMKVTINGSEGTYRLIKE